MDLIDYLGTERVDLVAIHDDMDCFLIHEVFSSGVVLHMRNWLRAYRRFVVCEDFLTDFNKLNILENSIKALMRRWQS